MGKKSNKDIRLPSDILTSDKVLNAQNIHSTIVTHVESGRCEMTTVAKKQTLKDVPDVPVQKVLDCLYQDEYGDALLFSYLFNGKVIYDHTGKEWYLFNKHYWQIDACKQVYTFVMGILSSVYIQASAELNLEIREISKGKTDDENKKDSEQARLREQVKALQSRAHALKMKHRMLNVLEIASSLLGITSDRWDCLDMAVCTASGVIDLRTGNIRDGKPEDYIRTIIPTEWKGLDEQCPRFEKFLHEIFDDRPEQERKELVEFLHMALGYAITGKASEHVFLMLFGEEGRNGKDTLMKAIERVMGDTVGAVSNDVLISGGKFVNPGAAKPHLVSLQGKRLAWASETDKGARFDVGQVKFLTGGGTIRVRQLHGKEYSYFPTHLLVLLTNNKPHADAKDRAFWERMCPITFNNRFVKKPTSPNERLADPALNDKLQEEASGILAWLVQGALKWNSTGLHIPECILKERGKYREEEDTLGMFLKEYCWVSPSYKVSSGLLYKKYVEWANENTLKPMSGTAFGTEIAKLYEKKRESAGYFYHGLGLKEDYPLHKEPEPEPEPEPIDAHKEEGLKFYQFMLKAGFSFRIKDDDTIAIVVDEDVTDEEFQELAQEATKYSDVIEQVLKG